MSQHKPAVGSQRLKTSPHQGGPLVRVIENKTRAMYPLHRTYLNNVIMNMLKIRRALNKKVEGARKKYQMIIVSAIDMHFERKKFACHKLLLCS